MKKWKIIFKITLAILIIFIIIAIIHAISVYSSDVTYPYSALGTDVHNWFDAFMIDIAFYLYIFGMPLIIDIILFIISIIKIKKLKNKL